jgi:lipopolysaccharide transport system permease protein
VTALVQDVREMLQEQVQYRDLLLQMIKRDLVLRYKQTFMGVAWAMFMPLVNTAVFGVVFTRVARIDVGMPYPVFAYCGLIVWNLFATSLKFSIGSLTSNMGLVTKVYFPREILPMSAVLVGLVDFAVAHVVLIGLMLAYGMPFHGTIVYLPAVLFVHVTFTVGLSLLVAMGNLFYRDVKYIFDVVLGVLLFATSVLYPISLVGGRAGEVLRLNPLSWIVDGYRGALVSGQNPLTPGFAITALAAFVTFAVAWIVFHRAEYRFAENV